MGQKKITNKNTITKMNFIIKKDEKEVKLTGIELEFDILKSQIAKSFNLNDNEFTISYVDSDGDMIAVEDNDDLDVCIFEFTETSKMEGSITLAIQEKKSAKSKIRKASAKNSPRSSRKVSEDLKGFEKLEKEESVLSEKVLSLMDSRIEEEVEKRINKMIQEKLADSQLLEKKQKK